MRLATILPHRAGEPVAVVAAPDGSWVELAAVATRPVRRLEDALPWWLAAGAQFAETVAGWQGRRFHEGEFSFRPPVMRPPAFRDFYAFEQHVKTARARRGLEMVPAWYEIPVFYFSNPNALVGHDAAIFAPADCAELDYELELGIIIGRGGTNIAPEQAWDHVAGFTVLNDFSARDLQRQEVPVGLGPAKAKDFATAVGPWLVTRDEFSGRIDGERLTLEMTARVNGCERSRGNVASLHHTIPRLIAQASRDAELLPGDLLGTGTVGTGCILELGAENVGGWLKPGDFVDLEIERIGVLRTRIVARPDGVNSAVQ
jgi:2-keto-4-pentenoate hydratase/2-oxohepta-3-ene-1,7-dioic acid hydratase in catechol pathway